MRAAQERRARDEARRLAEKEAAERARAEREAGARARTQRSPSPGGGTATLELIGFRPIGGTARVFVRTVGEPAYDVAEVDVRTVVVTLRDTRLGSANNARPLDTSFFGTAVQEVRARQVGPDVEVEVRLLRPVPYGVRRVGGELQLDFQGT